jgi:hypothetical protein
MGKVVEINKQLREADGNGLLPPLPPLPPYPPPPGQALVVEDAAATAQQQQQANPLANLLMAGIQAMRQRTPNLHRMAQASGIRTATPGRGTPVATCTPLRNLQGIPSTAAAATATSTMAAAVPLGPRAAATGNRFLYTRPGYRPAAPVAAAPVAQSGPQVGTIQFTTPAPFGPYPGADRIFNPAQQRFVHTAPQAIYDPAAGAFDFQHHQQQQQQQQQFLSGMGGLSGIRGHRLPT